MAKATARANARKSAVHGHIEHVFAHQKDCMGLLVRTIGLKRAEAKIAVASPPRRNNETPQLRLRSPLCGTDP